MNSMKKASMGVALGIVCILLGLAWPAFAAGFSREPSCRPPFPEPERGVMRLEIIGDSAGNLPIRFSGWDAVSRSNGGSGVIYVDRGERYRLRVTNLTGRRLGLVIAVDGRNILTGENSYGRTNEGLYVLNPYGSGEFTGWRTSLREVRRFYFTDADDSYAARLGDADRIGEISVTGFAERPSYPPPEAAFPHYRDKASGRSDSIRENMQAAPGPGTGWGERDYSPVHETVFDPESFPAARYLIRYEWERHEHHHHWYPRPDPRDFCPPPRR